MGRNIIKSIHHGIRSYDHNKQIFKHLLYSCYKLINIRKNRIYKNNYT